MEHLSHPAEPILILLFEPDFCIHLCLYITFTCYSVAYNQFSILYDHYIISPTALSCAAIKKKDSLLSWSFPFLTISWSSRVQFHQFLALSIHTFVFICHFCFQGFVIFLFEWQQVSSGLQDSSQYSGRSQQCCNLDGLDSSSNFQLLSRLLAWMHLCNLQRNLPNSIYDTYSICHFSVVACPVSRDCRIHRLHLGRGVCPDNEAFISFLFIHVYFSFLRIFFCSSIFFLFVLLASFTIQVLYFCSDSFGDNNIVISSFAPVSFVDYGRWNIFLTTYLSLWFQFV